MQWVQKEIDGYDKYNLHIHENLNFSLTLVKV